MRTAFAALTMCTLLFAPTPGWADSTPSLLLAPAPAGDTGFAVERAGVRGHLLLSARIATDYADAPLVLRNDQQQIDHVVAQQATTHALLSLALLYRVEVGLDMPVVVSQGGDAFGPGSTTAPRAPGAPALGDLRLDARVRIAGSPSDAETRADLALAAWAWLPTGAAYSGDGAVTAQPFAVAEIVGPWLYAACNAGARLRPSATLPGALPTRSGTSLALGIAAGFFADSRQRTALGTEIVADLPVADGARLLDPRATVAHVFATAHHRLFGESFEIGAALGPGIGQGPGSAAFRALAFVGWAPRREAPPPDRDGDGVPDARDACPDIPGASSPDRDLDGCPPPPADRDGDGVPDDVDACPTTPGLQTSDPRTNGCPEPVAPKVVEPPRAEIVQQAIVIDQQIQFATDSAVLLAESDAILGQILGVIRDHPEIALVEVQGHTDDQGTAEHNRQLGQARAESVVEWLVSRGIQRARLVAKGYGSDRPIADNSTEEGRRTNRRVELHILERTSP